MSKSNDNATLRYIKRQTRRLTHSVNSLIGGRRDLDSSAVLTPYDEGRSLNEREASSPDGDDNGTSPDVSSSSDDDCGANFTGDSTESDAVSMLLQSSEDEKNTNSRTIATLHDNLIFTDSPVVTKDSDLKSGSTSSGFHPSSNPIARLTPSEEESEDTTYVCSKVQVVSFPGSSQLSAMAVARGEAHITGSSDTLPVPSEYTAPSTQAAASSPFQCAEAAFVVSSVPASSTPGLTSNSIVSSDASSPSSSADSSSRSDVATSMCIAQSASSRLDSPSVTTAASPPSHFGTIPSQLPSHKPPSPAPSVSDLPSNKNRVRTLREIARLPAFYGSNDYVRMNWKKEYGAYEGHTSLPTWDSVHQQWQHSRNRDFRPPVVVTSADPLIGRVTITIPAPALASPALASPVHVPSTPSAPAASDVEGGSPSVKTLNSLEGKGKVKVPRRHRAATDVKNALLGTPQIAPNSSPNLRRSTRIARLSPTSASATRSSPISSKTSTVSASPVTSSPSPSPSLSRKRSREIDEDEEGSPANEDSVRKKGKRNPSGRTAETPTRTNLRKRK
ncbi:hypothetical protein DFJ43DRAFT_1228093 [Lentinula guzmanii]|uniref:Uncharacterized protein n=1 Tax=Lentinula guzmanii TaxID=2804957 RepID=A0AA38MVC0_9AGAR|nr:hypothetical protein DFJ43DRAFT_1228093 [Lentinula guzmanii]